jgi:ferredoxin-thioredoxin reductase catalytic subunit
MYGYHLNPETNFLQDLLNGLQRNWERYGYPSCPCRLASGNFEFDRDIVCPCDYRDPDVLQYGACYCALYVRQDISEGKMPVPVVPERRPLEKQTRSYEVGQQAKPAEKKISVEAQTATSKTVTKKIWYCKQCGYMVYREDPPYVCPICKAKREMFTEITLTIEAHG